jgi:AraC-like DNA-binding protein
MDLKDDSLDGHCRRDRPLRKFETDCGRGIRATLSHYSAQAPQPRHRHEYSQLSFLLAGSMQEDLNGAEYHLHGSGIGFKPAESWHSDVWGESGALIFSLRMNCDRAEALGLQWSPGWSRRADLTSVRNLLRLCLYGETQAVRSEAAEDLVAVTSRPAENRRPSRPPAWLEAARQQIIDSPELLAIDQVARSTDVHRVHFCRMFVRFYGVAPSVYRRRVLAARAVAGASRTNDPLAGIAYDAGFSDQSHMNRTLRLQTGFSPSALRALLGS